jgi:hypothetical protein
MPIEIPVWAETGAAKVVDRATRRSLCMRSRREDCPNSHASAREVCGRAARIDERMCPAWDRDGGHPADSSLKRRPAHAMEQDKKS